VPFDDVSQMPCANTAPTDREQPPVTHAPRAAYLQTLRDLCKPSGIRCSKGVHIDRITFRGAIVDGVLGRIYLSRPIPPS
jgi:hypothetical protein